MIFKTIEGVLHPDGRLTCEESQMPDRAVHVMVTLLNEEDDSLSEIGDYAAQLENYEDRLARGEIQW